MMLFDVLEIKASQTAKMTNLWAFQLKIPCLFIATAEPSPDETSWMREGCLSSSLDGRDLPQTWHIEGAQ